MEAEGNVQTQFDCFFIPAVSYQKGRKAHRLSLACDHAQRYARSQNKKISSSAGSGGDI